MKRFGVSKRHFNRLTKKLLLECDTSNDNNLYEISRSDNPLDRNDVIQLQCEDAVLNTEAPSEDDEFQAPLMSDIEYASDNEDAPNQVSELHQGLAQWVSECNIPRNHTDKLLKVLASCNVQNVPLCAKTLMSTPRRKIVQRTVFPGEYFHFGIQNYFLKSENQNIKDMKEISLDIGIDGLPLFKNSGQQKLWPIIGAFPTDKNIPLFLIGSYTGPNTPKSACDFLKDFVKEVKDLQRDGILVGSDNVPKQFNIRLFCCDAPARSFISGTIGHSGQHGCSKCCQIGTKPQKSGIIFESTVKEPRTDLSFLNRLHPDHHHCQYRNTKSALECLGIGMVSQIPIDPMHLFDLGITKKILLRLTLSKSVGYRPNVSSITKNLLKYTDCVPSEFQRKPRPLDLIHFWKATEFRQFALYTGIVALKDNVNDDIYYHFLTLHCAYRILSCPDLSVTQIDSAQMLLDNFVDNFSFIYGSDQISYNVHNLLHITDCVRQFGPTDSFSAYKFENFMQTLKKKIRKSNQILQQLYNRLQEKNNYEPVQGETKSSSRRFSDFVLDFDKEADSYCLISPDIPIKISGFGKNGNSEYIVGNRCQTTSSFFELPVDSSLLGIRSYETLSDMPEIFDIAKVQTKFFRIPYQNKFVLIPLLHSTFHSFSTQQ